MGHNTSGCGHCGVIGGNDWRCLVCHSYICNTLFEKRTEEKKWYGCVNCGFFMLNCPQKPCSEMSDFVALENAVKGFPLHRLVFTSDQRDSFLETKACNGCKSKLKQLSCGHFVQPQSTYHRYNETAKKASDPGECSICQRTFCHQCQKTCHQVSCTPCGHKATVCAACRFCLRTKRVVVNNLLLSFTEQKGDQKASSTSWSHQSKRSKKDIDWGPSDLFAEAASASAADVFPVEEARKRSRDVLLKPQAVCKHITVDPRSVSKAICALTQSDEKTELKSDKDDGKTQVRPTAGRELLVVQPTLDSILFSGQIVDFEDCHIVVQCYSCLKERCDQCGLEVMAHTLRHCENHEKCGHNLVCASCRHKESSLSKVDICSTCMVRKRLMRMCNGCTNYIRISESRLGNACALCPETAHVQLCFVAECGCQYPLCCFHRTAWPACSRCKKQLCQTHRRLYSCFHCGEASLRFCHDCSTLTEVQKMDGGPHWYNRATSGPLQVCKQCRQTHVHAVISSFITDGATPKDGTFPITILIEDFL